MVLQYFIKILCLFACLCCVNGELNLEEGSHCVSEGINGTCISVFGCQSAAMIYAYLSAGYDSKKAPTFPEICSYKDGVIIVCCTDCFLDDPNQYKDYVMTLDGEFKRTYGSKADQVCMDYSASLPYMCRGGGSVAFRKIVAEHMPCHLTEMKPGVRKLAGGLNGKRGQHPHMALLGYGANQKDAQWHCGGAIISERFILTAGHCLYHRMFGRVTYAALGLLKRSDPPKYWKIHKVKRIVRHPDYKPPTKYHDIALLETETEINFGRYVLPACLNTDYYGDIDYAEAAGWGNLGNSDSLSDTLQYATLQLFNDSECALQYPEQRLMERGYDSTTQMCYGAYKEVIDTCRGDSGGPLHTAYPPECLYTVVGVTSLGGSQCGVLGVPGIFTKVSHYVSWIESVVWPD